jgi:hypothetical protein
MNATSSSLLAALCAFALLSARAQAAAPPPAAEAPASTRITYPGDPAASVDDLRHVLEGYAAGDIELQPVAAGPRDGQSFFLRRQSGKTLIQYTTRHSLDNAVYTLLDRWGFRWYGPGDHWVVKPAAVPAGDIPGRWVTPTFRNRAFFGTGGLDAPPPNDPSNRYKAGWSAWKRRNRFNSDYAPTGHTGQAFYAQNRALLEAHPDWFNGPEGLRNGRIRIEVPQAVAAYKAWATKNVAGSKDPFVVIGVDPEDGRGGADDPLPPDGFAGLSHWNHADKWWWLANEIAKDFPEDGRVVVSMYAYGDGPTNALAPRFPLRRNVYPVVIPYAFQTAYVPADMVRTWASRAQGTMGLYDYWNITQWSKGLPQFDLYSMKGRLQFWRANKVDGLYAETTDAAGPMGHAWWLAGQLLFDLDQDFEALYQRYLTDCFGPAAAPMRRMYDRWSRHYQAAGEVSLSLADLKEADSRVERDTPAWRRVNDLKAYVHFMKLSYDHDGTAASRDRLYEYLYAIHDLYLVQTSAFIGQRYVAPPGEPPKTVVMPPTPDEIDARFRADLKSDPKRYDVVDFRFDFAKATFTGPAKPTAWRFGSSPTAYFVPKSTGPLSFDAGAERSDADFSLSSDDAVLLRENVGPGHFDSTETFDGRTWHLKRFTANVEAGKRYTVKLAGGYNRFRMNGNEIVFVERQDNDFDNYAYPAQYFYVPRSCSEIVYEEGFGVPASFAAPGEPESNAVRGTPLGIRNLYRVEVKPGWRGHVIAARFAHSSWSLKNLPNVLAIQPFEYAE